MLEQYAYLATEFFELINIVVSISPGTGPLERSYSKLERICKKDRNNLGDGVRNGVRKFGPLIMKK